MTWAVSQHTDTNMNTEARAVSQHTETNKNTEARAVSQHTDTNKNTRATLKWHALHKYVGVIFSHEKWI